MTKKTPDAACLKHQLRCAEEGLRLLAENLVDHALVMLDAQGCILHWNDAAQRMKGFRADEIVGRHFSAFYSGPEIELGIPRRDLGIASVMGRFEDEGWRLRKDGTVFRARVVCTAIRDDVGELLGFAELTHRLSVCDGARTGYASCSMEAVSLTQTLLECRRMVQARAQRRGVRLGFSKVDTPCVIRADRQHVKQVLVTLLSNAIDRNQAGGWIKVECNASAPQRMRVSVRDSGAGLSPDQLAGLLPPCASSEENTGAENREDGGLALTRQLVESMGGSIGAQSALGGGSVFWIELVVATAPQPSHDDAELFVLTPPPPIRDD